MGFKNFMRKVFQHAASGYGGYQIGELIHDQQHPVIVKSEVILPSRKEESISVNQIVIVLVALVLLAFLLVTIKYIIKRLTPRRSSDIIPMHQCNINAQRNVKVKSSSSKRRDEVEADSSN